MTPATPPTEYELHAFVDNELDPRRHEQVADYLRQAPALSAQVAAWRIDRDLLRQAFNEVIDQPMPPGYAARFGATVAGRRRVPPRILTTRRFALAASVAAVASVAAIRLSRQDADTILAEADAAREGRLPGRIAGGDRLAPPAERDGMIRQALAMPVRAPALDRHGFGLASLELYARPSGGAAHMRYTDASQRALTIFVRHSDGNVQFDIQRRGDSHVCVWQDDVVGAVITAQVSAAEMLRIASSAYTSLNL
jgi:hypothetical protein